MIKLTYTEQTISIPLIWAIGDEERPAIPAKVTAMVADGVGLCYHETLPGSSVDTTYMGYTITHIASMKGICETSTIKQAERVISLLSEITDWSNPSTDILQLPVGDTTVGELARWAVSNGRANEKIGAVRTMIADAKAKQAVTA